MQGKNGIFPSFFASFFRQKTIGFSLGTFCKQGKFHLFSPRSIETISVFFCEKQR